MNVERTVEFILQSQARAEVRAAKTDKRIESIARILQQGMRMLAKTDARLAELAQTQKELAQAQKELAQAQKETAQSLKAWLRRSNNGGPRSPQ